MPLLIKGKSIKYGKNTLESLISNIDWQKEQITLFESSASNKETLSKDSLIVLQGECASIKLNTFECIGTPWATTCNIIFIFNKTNTKILCAHLDEGVDKKQMTQIFNLFHKTELKAGVNIYIIGGYLDEKAKSVEVTRKILNLLGNNRPFKKYNMHLCLLMTAKLNTKYKKINNAEHEITVPIPKYQTVAYDLKQQKFICFDIHSRNIPYTTLRSALMFDAKNEGALRVIYDCCNANHVRNGPTIEEFHWKCPDWIQNVLYCNLSDDKILEYFSTSPHAEHGEFAKDSKKLFKFLSVNEAKYIFKGKPIYMKCGVTLDNNDNKKNDDDLEEKSSK